MNNSVIFTTKGLPIDLDYYTEKSVDIDSIADGLSRTYRFAGQGAGRVSVLKHSVILARLVSEIAQTGAAPLYALLHDAPEAYLGDLCSPFKRAKCMALVYSELQKIHEHIMNTICATIGIEVSDDDLALIKHYDKWQALYEARGIFGIDHTSVRVQQEYLESKGVCPFSEKQEEIIKSGLNEKMSKADFMMRFDYYNRHKGFNQ